MTGPAARPVRRRTAAVAVTVLALAAAACASSTAGKSASTTASTTGAAAKGSGPSAGCNRSPAAAAGTTDERITSGGVERSYLLTVPDGYDAKKPLPLVFGLHSLTVDYHVVPPMAGFADMAATYDFIAVAPSGLLGPTDKPFWNAAPVPDNYDVVFLTELLDHLEATLCVDTARVFSIGMSNGAQMSSLLACRIGDRIAAIAPIAGVEYNEPCAGPPVGVVAFHGMEDKIVPYAGGGLNSVTIAAQNYYKGTPPPGVATPTGVDESMQRWALHNGCGAEPVEVRLSPEVRKRTWPHCVAPTVLYVVDNGGHAWPGKPQPEFESMLGHGTTEIDATAVSFRFFFDHEV